MLEELIKVFFSCIIFSLFIIYCFSFINESFNQAVFHASHSLLLYGPVSDNLLINYSGNISACRPSSAGRVCYAFND